MRRFATAALLIIAASAASSCRKKAVVNGADSGAAADTSAIYTRNDSGRVTRANPQIRILCANGTVMATIRPWEIAVNSGAQVVWRVMDLAQTDTVTISPKAGGGGTWVLDGTPPYGRRGDGDIDGGTARRVTAPDTSAFEIAFECTDPSGKKYKGMIDPEIIVTEF